LATPRARRLEPPLEAQVRDQAGDGHPLAVALGVEQLRHRKVGVTVRVHRVLPLARLRDVVTDGSFTRFRRATETPFNIVLEARP
jgi:hypothetical protein